MQTINGTRTGTDITGGITENLLFHKHRIENVFKKLVCLTENYFCNIILRFEFILKSKHCFDDLKTILNSIARLNTYTNTFHYYCNYY